jgi:hypothetical protein
MKTSEYVAELAKTHNVVYERTQGDVIAEKFSELSDNEVNSDDTCDLLVALCRAKVITQRDMASLLTKHLREIKENKNVLSGR